MLLNMDQNGRIYQAASHRSDGLGFEEMPEIVDETDVYHEGAALDSSREINSENQYLCELANQEKITQEQLSLKNEYIKRQNAKIQSYLNTVITDPLIQENLAYEGLKQNISQSADFNQLAISGYGLSSNGIIGPTRHEKAIERALMQQLGEAPETAETALVEDIYDVSPLEREQLELNEMYQASQNKLWEAEANELLPEYKTPQTSVSTELPALEADLEKIQAQSTSKLKDLVAKIPPWGWVVAGVLSYKLLTRKK